MANVRRDPTRWRAVEARLGREMNIWMATTRGDGRPHLVPIWYVWLDGKIYLATGAQTQKFINLRNNQSVALALPDAVNVIIVEGEAHVANRMTVELVAEHFFNKYEWDFRYDDTAEWRLIEVTPHKIRLARC
jgi:nitroimidazol reductase NimA-like FMN-containing flavoprotein (pyridoxamine 5'-phosphate oxidase superfamily)